MRVTPPHKEKQKQKKTKENKNKEVKEMLEEK